MCQKSYFAPEWQKDRPAFLSRAVARQQHSFRNETRAADACGMFCLLNRASNSLSIQQSSRERHQPVTREDLSQLTGGQCDPAGNISSDSSESSAVLAHVSDLLRRWQHEF